MQHPVNRGPYQPAASSAATSMSRRRWLAVAAATGWPRAAAAGVGLSGHGARLMTAVASGTGVWAASAGAPAMAREALPLPLALDAPADADPAGYLVSEKFDGVRALWDGRELRFRGGGIVAAPAWFRAALPSRPLDGELWMGRGRFEALSAAVRRQQPRDEEWRRIRYQVFELPAGGARFDARVRDLAAQLRAVPASIAVVVEQRRVASRAELAQWLATLVAAGGEGLVLRRADAAYAAGRDGSFLKLKPLADAEATVIGHEAGQGRLNGMLGALRVRNDEGIEFRIGTGLDDRLRQAPPPAGTRITYTYRGLTDKGVPRFASFLRVRPAGV